MTERARSKFKIGWLLAATSFIVMPVFSFSGTDFRGVGNALYASTMGVFLLSFPISLITLPILFLNSIALGFHDGSFLGQYMVAILLAFTGYLQWFWIVPRIFVGGSELQRLDLRESVGNRKLFERTPETYSDWYDGTGTSPLEHVIRSEGRPHSG